MPFGPRPLEADHGVECSIWLEGVIEPGGVDDFRGCSSCILAKSVSGCCMT